jgi:hypothetical protein
MAPGNFPVIVPGDGPLNEGRFTITSCGCLILVLAVLLFALALVLVRAA